MPLANFLDKAALAASQVLQEFNRKQFEQILLSHRIRIIFNSQLKTREVVATLDLLVCLLSRLYPNLQIMDIQGESVIAQDMEELARSINPDIDLDKTSSPTISLAIGQTNADGSSPTFYLGSNGWVAYFSPTSPIQSGDTNNPFGAGAAACIGTANVFRYVFAKQLPYGFTDEAFAISLLNYTLHPQDSDYSNLPDIDSGETHFIGLGAIGNAAIWALSEAKSITGIINLIDGEKTDLSNLQRYVLASQNDLQKPKTLLAKQYLNDSKLEVISYPMHWEKYLQKHNNWQLTRVAIGVDTARDRIAAQAALPKKIINAWTQANDLGVSRHFDFIKEACLACLYMPTGPKKNYSELVAQAIGLPQKEQLIRGYLYGNIPVDLEILEDIAKAKNINIESLLPFVGDSLTNFYNKAVCGGMLLGLSGETEEYTQVEAPLAFQSALAGIMLAGEVLIDAGNLRKKAIPNITRLNLLRPISIYLSEQEGKNSTGACICNDTHFRKIYAKKWRKPLTKSATIS